jgi:hypothetical protein
MDAVEIVLTVIKNAWVTRISHVDLVLTLYESYRMPQSTSEPIIHNLLMNGFISASSNRRYGIEKLGLDWLSNKYRVNFAETAHQVANTAPRELVKKEKSPTDWNNFRAAIIIGIILIVIGAATLYYTMHPANPVNDKVQLDSNKAKNAYNHK